MADRLRVYDPPSGWRYGFPKQYKPLPGETLAETLLRDGYPQKEIDWGGAEHVRFWSLSAVYPQGDQWSQPA